MSHPVFVGSRIIDLAAITRIRYEGDWMIVYFVDGAEPWSLNTEEAAQLGAAIRKAQQQGRAA